MKHLHIKNIILILITFLFSCSSDDEKESNQKSIIGLWNATNYSGYVKHNFTTFYYYDNGEVKEEKDSSPAQNDPWNRDLQFGRNLWTFNSDKSMTTQNGNISNMNYEKYLFDLSKNQILLYKTSTSATPTPYDIEEYTNTKLVISIYEETWGSGIEEDIYDEKTHKIIGKKRTEIEGKRYDKITFEKVE